jgi:hypothetical protein
MRPHARVPFQPRLGAAAGSAPPSTVASTSARAQPSATAQPSASALSRASPRLLDRVRLAIRARHYSPRTEKAYVAWIRQYISFHGKRHPDELGAPEVAGYLSHLA